MSTSRTYHSATRLPNGDVLLAGGTARENFFDGTTVGELFNPATGKFTTTANGGTNTVYLRATLLGNGKVLVAGGFGPGIFCGFCGPTLVSTANSFLFNGATASFTKTGGMSQPRARHTATLLIGGEVLITGGTLTMVEFCRSGCPVTRGGPLASAELYNPASGTFSLTSAMTNPRTAHTATLLGNGGVLVAGGQDVNRNALTSAELYE
jgi:Galactose oxidase, central domain